jgi:ADP-heptose:LPS heptosyltransferase
MHSAELAFTAARALDPELRFEDFVMPPELPVPARRAAQAILDEIPSDRRILVVHADTKPDKSWRTERFITALDAFLEARPDFIALVVGRNALGLDRGEHGAAVVGCEGLPLATSLALAAEADLFFGVDSCVLHAADFCRIPSVGIFGPTDPHEFGCRVAPACHLGGASDSTDAVSVTDAVAALEAMAATWCLGGPRRLADATLCTSETAGGT